MKSLSEALGMPFAGIMVGMRRRHLFTLGAILVGLVSLSACHEKPQIIEIPGIPGAGSDGGPKRTGDDITLPSPDSGTQTGPGTGTGQTGTTTPPTTGTVTQPGPGGTGTPGVPQTPMNQPPNVSSVKLEAKDAQGTNLFSQPLELDITQNPTPSVSVPSATTQLVFTVSALDPEGGPLQYILKTSGNVLTQNNTGILDTASHRFLTGMSYLFNLIVEDNQVASWSLDVPVQVTTATRPSPGAYAPLPDSDQDGTPDLSDFDDDNDGTIDLMDSQPFNPNIPGPLAGLIDGQEFLVDPDGTTYGLYPSIALSSELVMSWVKGGDIFIDLPLRQDPAFRKQITTGGNNNNPVVAILNRFGTNGNIVEFVVVWNTLRNTLRDIKYKIFQFKIQEKQLIDLSVEAPIASGIPQDSYNLNWIGLDSNRVGDFVVAWAQTETISSDPAETIQPIKIQIFLRTTTGWRIPAPHYVLNPNFPGPQPNRVENPDIALSDNFIVVSFKGHYYGVCKNGYEFLSKTDYSLQLGNSTSCTTNHPQTGLPIQEQPYIVATKAGDGFIFATLKEEEDFVSGQKQINYYYKGVTKDSVASVPLIKQTLRFLPLNSTLRHYFQELVANRDGYMIALANVALQDLGLLGNLIAVIPPATANIGVKTISDDNVAIQWQTKNSIVVSENNRFARSYRKTGGIYLKIILP